MPFRRLAAVLLALLIPGLSAGSQDTSPEIVHVGNEGFLVSHAGKRVLVDALQGPGLKGYVAAGGELRQQLESATGPFADVDLVLVTHHHPDHFHVGAVAAHLRANPKAHLVSTKETVRRLSADATIAERLHAFEPGVEKPETAEIGGVRLTIFRMHHGGPDPVNLGYLVQQGSFRWLHVGDTSLNLKEWRAFDLKTRDVDTFFVPYWHLLDDNAEAVLRSVGADRVVPMHVPSRGAPRNYFSPAPDLDGLWRKLGQVVNVDRWRAAHSSVEKR